MSWYTHLSHALSHYIFSWRDVVEIALFSVLIYTFSLWLKKDKQKNLLFYFYGYCALLLGTYYVQLPTVHFLLFATAPIAVVLFIVIHQEILQRNFVTLRNITPAAVEQTDWLETLIRTVMIAANNNTSIYCIIEHTHSMATVISSPLLLHADLQKNLFTMVLESDAFEQDKLLWINSKGQLLGINASWKSDKHHEWLDDGARNLNAWQQDALFFTANTDAIVFHVNPENRLFSIVAQGKICDNIPGPLALKTIEKYLSANQVIMQKKSLTKKESEHEHKKTSSGQRNA